MQAVNLFIVCIVNYELHT